MKFLKAILAVTVAYSLVEGLDATGECQFCNLKEKCDPSARVQCDDSPTARCATIKILDSGVVKYTKLCRSQQLCNKTSDLCRITDRHAATQTCLAAGCCDTDRCEANLTSLLTPASTTHVANAMPTATTRDAMPTPTTTLLVLRETRTTVEMVTSSAHISPSTAISKSSSRAVKDTVPTVETTMGAKMPELASSMPVVEKPSKSVQTNGSGTFTSHVLVDLTTRPTRPTCPDAAGMRHVVTPLAISLWLMVLVMF